MKLSLEELSEILEKSTLRYFILSFANNVYNFAYNSKGQSIGKLEIHSGGLYLFNSLVFINVYQKFKYDQSKLDTANRIDIRKYIGEAVISKPKEIAEILNLLFQDSKNGEQLASVTVTGLGIFRVKVHKDIRTSFIFQYIIAHSSPME